MHEDVIDQGFDFRDRLGENRWKELFFTILKQIEDAGFAKGNQSTDASYVIANIAIPGTIGLIRLGDGQSKNAL